MQPWPLFLAGEPAIVNRGACSKRIRGGAEQKAVPVRYCGFHNRSTRSPQLSNAVFINPGVQKRVFVAGGE